MVEISSRNTIPTECGKEILEALIHVIHKNRQYLSKIDGAIGDGDHGINMDKGFTRAESLLVDLKESLSLADAFTGLGEILLNDIGGSMGPIYGTFFLKMGEAAKSSMNIDKGLFFRMLVQARKGLQEIGNAQVGDKTLIDTLVAAENALQKSIEKGDDSVKALHAMVEGARSGMESTKEMVAKLGRAARLGERSRGTLDPGATSCFILLEAMALKTTELFKQ